MRDNKNIPQRQFIDVPGYKKQQIIVQTMKIPDIRNTVFHFGRQPDGSSMKSRVFDHPMFAIAFLSNDELMRVNRFKALKKQMEWLCGRFALKILAKDILDLDMPLSEIRIDYREKGAPYLAQFSKVPISLSHSGDYTAAAIAQDTEMVLGIDIEKIGNMPDDGFMKTAFTKDEIAHMALDAPTVFARWTMKEAFLKFLGLGFNESLHHVAVINNQVYHCGQKQAVHSWSCLPDDQYVLSLIYARKNKPGSHPDKASR